MKRYVSLLLVLCAAVVIVGSHALAGEAGIEQALQDSRIRSGLCVIVRSADAEFAASLSKYGSFLVNGLSANSTGVAEARRRLLDQRLYGEVSVEEWRGPALPYADNLVSLLLVLEPATIGDAELLRVLNPGGEMIVKSGNEFRRTTKPRPAGVDEWTHWRHGPDRNAGSSDRVVDVPERVQWLAAGTAISDKGQPRCGKERQE